MEVRNSSLLLFDQPPVQTDIQSYYLQEYFPLNTLNTAGPLEFTIEGNTEEYIDVNDIRLYVQAQVKQSDGSALDGACKAALANLPIATLFRDVSLHIGATQVEGGQMMYPYLGYFSNVLEFASGAQKTHMQSLGWYKDTAGKFEAGDNTNKGFQQRQAMIEADKTFELYGPLYLNFFRQPQYLVSNTPMRVKLLPSEPEFACNVHTASKSVKIEFKKVILYVPRMRMNPSVINGHEAGLAKRNALYPLQHAEVTTFTIPKGQSSYVEEHLFPYQCPKLCIVAFVENEAFNGAYAKNPFHFQHFNLTELALYHGGAVVNGHPFTPDFKNDLCMRDYMNLMEVFKYSNTENDNGLTKEDFTKGYTFYAYDLTPDRSLGEPHRQAIIRKDFRLQLTFSKPLSSTINVLLYCVYDSQIEITKLRDVITHYGRSADF